MNVYESVSVVYGKTFLQSILAALSARPAAALILAGKLRLSKDPAFIPASGATVAGYAAHEADFSGYPAGGLAVTLVGPLNISADEWAVGFVGAFLAAPAGPFVPNVIFGWWIDDGTNVVASEAFGGGATADFGAPGDWLDLSTLLPLNALSNV